jgi:hypothetical protein
VPNLDRPSSTLDAVARALARIENEVRLVGRAAPPDVGLEIARLVREFTRATRITLRGVQGAPALLGETRRSLARLSAISEELGPFGALHAARARELELEARLAEALGTPGVRALAAERFPAPPAARARECDGFVSDALSVTVTPSPELHRSDDHGNPKSLVARLGARARELGLSLRIDVRKDQVAVAATGHGLVCVRPGVLLSAHASERVATHELLAHALPRARSSHAPWALFGVGTRGAGEDEEGRALLIEERSGLLDAERRRSLALRHVSAFGVRAGAEPTDTLRELVTLGAPLEQAAELTLRAHRGGGLGRELVYLPAYFAVRSALAAEPGLERWIERGRLDLETARRLASGELEWQPPAPPLLGELDDHGRVIGGLGQPPGL